MVYIVWFVFTVHSFGAAYSNSFMEPFLGHESLSRQLVSLRTGRCVWATNFTTRPYGNCHWEWYKQSIVFTFTCFSQLRLVESHWMVECSNYLKLWIWCVLWWIMFPSTKANCLIVVLFSLRERAGARITIIIITSTYQAFWIKVTWVLVISTFKRITSKNTHSALTVS